MKLLKLIDQILYGKNFESEEPVNNLKYEIEKVQREYDELISLQEKPIQNLGLILQTNFFKKEKYIDLLNEIGFKNIPLIKQYEDLVIRYNILVELFIKLKEYLSKNNCPILAEFAADNYNQPVFIMSLNNNNKHKIVLLKNTFNTEDYLLYEIKENFLIKEIHLEEINSSHCKLLLEMLDKTIIFLNKSNYNKIKISNNVVEKLSNKEETQLLLSKCGFNDKTGEFIKVLDAK